MFTCRRCKHDDMMHYLFTGYCIERGCDCLSMDGLFDDAWIDRAAAARGDGAVCTHDDTWFDRTICNRCGSMHTICNDCGAIVGHCRPAHNGSSNTVGIDSSNVTYTTGGAS